VANRKSKKNKRARDATISIWRAGEKKAEKRGPIPAWLGEHSSPALPETEQKEGERSGGKNEWLPSL